MNNLIRILETYPDAPWHWPSLTTNPNIDLNYIDSHQELPWVFETSQYTRFGISNNPNLTIKYIIDHPNLPWHWESITRNPNITLSDIENNLELPWKWDYIVQNPNITLDFVFKYEDKIRESFRGIFINSETIDDERFNRVICCTSFSPNITMQDFDNYPEIFNDKQKMSRNPNITLDYVFSHPDDNWNNVWKYVDIAQSSLITFEDVQQYPEVLNNYKFIEYFSKNPNISPAIVKNNKNVHWNWICLCKNPAFTIDELDACYDNWSAYWKIFYNPNLTLETLEKCLEKCDAIIGETMSREIIFNIISENLFHRHPYFDNQIIIRI